MESMFNSQSPAVAENLFRFSLCGTAVSVRKGNVSFIFIVFLCTIFQERFSEPANFSNFPHAPPVVTAMGFVKRTALWEFGFAFIFCVDSLWV